MYIHRVITRGVPGLADQDLTFYNTWTDEPLRNVLLIGPNGSGKTTLLRVIAGLWENLRTYLVEGQAREYKDPILYTIQFAALEIRDFLDTPLWIVSSTNYQFKEWLAEVTIAPYYFIGEVGSDLPYSGKHHSFDSNVTKESWFIEKSEALRKAQISGNANNLPNLVYINAYDRRLNHAQSQSQDLNYEPLYRWIATYDPNINEDNIELRFRNLKIRDEVWFQSVLKQINEFFADDKKALTNFDDYLHLRISSLSNPEQYHYIGALSDGEQQIVLLIFMISRWLMPGGVVLIDEPDLHLHLSWQGAMIHTLKQAVAAKGGQLIVTSHAERSWGEFSTLNTFNLNPLLANAPTGDHD